MRFLLRKVVWNTEGFSWTHDPKHTLPLAEAFGCNGKKQLEQVTWHVSVAGIKDGGQRFA